MRKKVKLAFIVNDASRKSTYNKRKNGLLKKVSELSILCGIPACAIIYGENGSKLDLWPPSPISVRRVVSKFLDMPVMEQSKKMINHEGFLRERILRTEEQLQKQMRDNREMEMTRVMIRAMEELLAPLWLQSLTMLDLTDLEWVIDQTLKQVNHMQAKLSKAGSNERTQIAADGAETVAAASTSNESALKHDFLMGLSNPLEQVVLPLEGGINPNSSMWSNSFLP